MCNEVRTWKELVALSFGAVSRRLPRRTEESKWNTRGRQCSGQDVNLGPASYETGVSRSWTRCPLLTLLTSRSRFLLEGLIFAEHGQEIPHLVLKPKAYCGVQRNLRLADHAAALHLSSWRVLTLSSHLQIFKRLSRLPQTPCVHGLLKRIRTSAYRILKDCGVPLCVKGQVGIT